MVLIPNHNVSTAEVDIAVFRFGPSAGSGDDPISSTLDEAVEELIQLLPPDERRKLAGIPKEQLVWETYTISMGIRNSWHLWAKDSPLMRQFPGQQPDDVSSLIIDAAWEKLQHGEE